MKDKNGLRRKMVILLARRAETSEKLSAEMDKTESTIISGVTLLHMIWPAALVSFVVWIAIIPYNEFAATLIPLLLFFSVYIVDCIVTSRCGKIIKKENQQRDFKIQFYKECCAHGITEKMSATQKQKAELLAQRLGCEYNNIELYYKEAKELCQTDADKKEEERINAEIAQLRKKELERHRNLTRFVSYTGRDKRIATLEYAQQTYQSKAAELRKTAKDVVHYSQYREINPGVAGGIASGLLGGAAGVAAYMDAENENAKIRATNQANLNLLAPGIIGTMNNASECEKRAKELQYSIDDAKIKLVSEMPDDKVFSYLSISTKTAEISKTGAFSITAEVKVNTTKQSLMIEDANGVIDGTIAAELYQDEKNIGRALMMLPTFGVKDHVTVEGIALTYADTSKPYEIKFSPYHLWIMEE